MPNAPNTRDRFRGCLLGLAAGDAVGTAVEFQPRGSFPPLTDMIGGGPFGLRPGSGPTTRPWRCAWRRASSNARGFDARDQMERYLPVGAATGYLSSTGTCFDIGGTVGCRAGAVHGDGRSLRRIPTIPDRPATGASCVSRRSRMFYLSDIDTAERFAAESARTTHGAEECLDASRLFSRILVRALSGLAKDDVLFADGASFTGSAKIVAIARGDYRRQSVAGIRGTGYVVDCLEAALWCFLQTGSFRDAVLMAANLGDDADTTAAVCGQVAGAYHGAAEIPATGANRSRCELTSREWRTNCWTEPLAVWVGSVPDRGWRLSQTETPETGPSPGHVLSHGDRWAQASCVAPGQA